MKIKSMSDVSGFLWELDMGKYCVVKDTKDNSNEMLVIEKDSNKSDEHTGVISISVVHKHDERRKYTPVFTIHYADDCSLEELNHDKTYRHKALGYIYEFRRYINNNKLKIRNSEPPAYVNISLL